MQSIWMEFEKQVFDIERKVESRFNIKINESVKKEVSRFN